MKTLKIRKKANWGFVFFLMLCELVILFIGISIFYNLLQDTFFYNIDLFLILLVMAFVWVKILDVIIWNLKGVEEIKFEDSYMVIEKRGKIFPLRKMITYDSIDLIEIEKPSKDLWLNMFSLYEIINYGAIRILYKKGKYAYRIGQSLTLKEAEKMMEQIKSRVPFTVIFSPIKLINESIKITQSVRKNKPLRHILFACVLLTVLQLSLFLCYFLIPDNRALASTVFFMSKISFIPALFLWISCIIICLRKDEKPVRLLYIILGSFFYAPFYYYLMIKNKYI